jgi:hypothetical protein
MGAMTHLPFELFNDELRCLPAQRPISTPDMSGKDEKESVIGDLIASF